MNKSSLASLAFLVITIFYVLPGQLQPDDKLIQFEERIEVDTAAGFKDNPRDFCLTEDGIFIFPDSTEGNVKLLTKEGKSLKLLRNFGEKFGKEGFVHPTYCFYSQKNGLLGIIDYGAKFVFVFERNGKDEFQKIKSVECPRLGYDMEFAGDGKHLIVSGYTTDNDNNPYDLYMLDIKGKTQKFEYLLPSQKKYYLESHESFRKAFFSDQTLPAIGIQAFCDISGDNVFYVWQGSPLQFIRLNLVTKESVALGDKLPMNLKVEKKMGDAYRTEDFKRVSELRKTRPYVKNIFATSQYIFLPYAPPANDKFPLRLKIFTPEGQAVSDVEIPSIAGDPLTPMYLDKTGSELFLYVLTNDTNNGVFAILKYKING